MAANGEIAKHATKPGEVFTEVDRDRLLALWREMGSPEVPLGQGVDVHDLERFLAHCIAHGFTQEIEQCRRYLTSGKE